MKILQIIASDPAERKQEEVRTFAMETKNLHVSTPAGSIRIEPGSDDRIHLRALKRLRAADAETAKDFLSRIQLRNRVEDGVWVLEAEWPDPSVFSSAAKRIDSVSVDLELQVPRGLDIEARSGGGDLALRGAKSAMLDTRNGSVTADEVEGILNAESGGGDIQAAKIGEARLRTNNGRIRANSVGDAADLWTGGGDIQIEDCEGASKVETRNGSIKVEHAGGSATALSGGGDITLRGAKSAELNTRNGSVTAENVEGILNAESGGGDIRATNAGETHLRTNNGRISAASIKGFAELWTGGGDIRIDGGEGAIKAETRNGRIDVKNAEGLISAESGGGDISVENAGESHLNTRNGAIQVRNTHGGLTLASGGGDLRVSGCRGEVKGYTKSGKISIVETTGPIAAATEGGDISIDLPETSDAIRDEFTTKSGAISVNLPLHASVRLVGETRSGRINLDPAVEAGRKLLEPTRFEAALGEGAGSIHLQTGGGDISISVRP
jgi:DUF4097 and DUF4098 domain-containing protein YvlB